MISNGIDRHVGGRLKDRRLVLGRTIAAQAAAIGVDEVTIEAYESGSARVPVTDLFRFFESLEIRPADVFEGFEGSSRRTERPASRTGV